jgi:hypothetical protein
MALTAVGSVASFSIHAAHGHAPIGLAGAGLRLTLPPIFALVGLSGSCLADGFESGCASSAASVGYFVGALGASALDVGLLAWDRSNSGVAKESYGWQTLSLDAAGALLGVYAIVRTRAKRDEPEDPMDASTDEKAPTSSVLSLAFGMYLIGGFGAPIVHFAHGRVGIGFADAGARLLGIPLLGVAGLASFCAASGGRDDCTRHGFEGGMLAGAVLVAGLDAFWLAEYDVEASEARSPAPGLSFQPLLMPVEGGLVVGAAGGF